MKGFQKIKGEDRMYNNYYYSDNFEYVRSNLQKNEVIEYIELSIDQLPEHYFEDDPKRYWEVWKKVRGYKLYNSYSLREYKVNYINNEEKVEDGMVRLYRTSKKVVSGEKTTVP